jgi:hypothetical protein
MTRYKCWQEDGQKKTKTNNMKKAWREEEEEEETGSSSLPNPSRNTSAVVTQ